MNLDKSHKIALVTVLTAGLTGALTVAGISAASSDPGADSTDSADCERYAEQFGMGDLGDMMDGAAQADRLGSMGWSFMGGGSGMGSMGS